MKRDPLEVWKPLELTRESNIETSTFKMKVPGGWLYRVSVNYKGIQISETMAFVPHTEDHGEVEGL